MAAALVSSFPAFIVLAVELLGYVTFSSVPALVSFSSIPATLVWYSAPFALGDSSGNVFVDSNGNKLSP